MLAFGRLLSMMQIVVKHCSNRLSAHHVCLFHISTSIFSCRYHQWNGCGSFRLILSAKGERVKALHRYFCFIFYWRWLLGAYCMIANMKRDRKCTSMWMNQYWIRWAYVVVVNLLWRGYKHWSSEIRAGAVVAVICVCVSPLFKCIHTCVVVDSTHCVLLLLYSF